MNLKSSLIALAALIAAPFASAQITLNDFSNFASSDTFFVGDWDGGGNGPRATFSQGAGFYNFTGGSDDNQSGAFYFFPTSPGNLTGYSLLQISARILPGNTASSFLVSIFSGQFSAFVSFSASDFIGQSFTTLTLPFSIEVGFDPTAVDSFSIRGDGLPVAPGILNLAVNNLAVVTPRVLTPVPEASTYGLTAAALLVSGVVLSRKKRALARA